MDNQFTSFPHIARCTIEHCNPNQSKVLISYRLKLVEIVFNGNVRSRSAKRVFIPAPSNPHFPVGFPRLEVTLKDIVLPLLFFPASLSISAISGGSIRGPLPSIISAPFPLRISVGGRRSTRLSAAVSQGPDFIVRRKPGLFRSPLWRLWGAKFLFVSRSVQPPNGSTIGTPAFSKSVRFRVTIMRPCIIAVAAMRLSFTGIAFPLVRKRANSSAHFRPVSKARSDLNNFHKTAPESRCCRFASASTISI